MGNDASHGEGYQHVTSGACHSHGYLLPAILNVLGSRDRGQRIFELGCGSGYVANHLASKGFDIVAVDPSDDPGILQKARCGTAGGGEHEPFRLPAK